MPCCAGSACDECGRNGILESEGNKCPVCNEAANPEELIPYRLFRDKVDKFRNSTGYTPRPAPIALNLVKPSLPDIVLPIIGRMGEPQSSPILPSGSPADFTRSPPPQKSQQPAISSPIQNGISAPRNVRQTPT